MYKHRLHRIVVSSSSHRHVNGRWVPNDAVPWEKRHFLNNPWLGVRSMGSGNFLTVRTRGGLDREVNRLPLIGEHQIEIGRQRKGGGKQFPDRWAIGFQNIPGTPSWTSEVSR